MLTTCQAVRLDITLPEYWHRSMFEVRWNFWDLSPTKKPKRKILHRQQEEWVPDIKLYISKANCKYAGIQHKVLGKDSPLVYPASLYSVHIVDIFLTLLQYSTVLVSIKLKYVLDPQQWKQIGEVTKSVSYQTA